MNCYGSGLITVLLYGVAEQAAENNNAIVTELGTNILTETSQNILIET